MAIKSIKVRNFKTFKNLDLKLDQFNILIGANASGKSNLIQIFRFLRDFVHSGLDNAVSIQGGPQYLKNVNSTPSEEVWMEIVSDSSAPFPFFEPSPGDIPLEISETTYTCTLGWCDKEAGMTLLAESVSQKYSFRARRGGARDSVADQTSGTQGGVLSIRRLTPDGPLEVTTPTFKNKKEREERDYFEIVKQLLRDTRAGSGSPLLNHNFLSIFMMPLLRPLGSLVIYDFDPKAPKRAVSIIGKNELESDGSNLAIVLNRVLSKPESKRKFLNLVHDMLPFVQGLDTERFIDRSMFFKTSETYAPGVYIPASLMSDGTINLIAIITALYFEDHPLIIIEEPERNVHPFLMSKLVSMLKDASSTRKQILISTHNPEIVRYADLTSLVLVSRRKDGSSELTRPNEEESVNNFLKEEIGIEDLYVNDLLGVG